MFDVIAKRLFGTANDRYLKTMRTSIDAINALEPQLEALSDEALAERTPWLRERIDQGEGLDDWVAALRKQFAKVHVTKPKASRSESREVFVVAQGFRA